MPESPPPSAPFVVLPRELGHVPAAPALVGEKAFRLSELLVLKARVPRFGVVTTAAFDALTSESDIGRLVAAARADDLGDEVRRVGRGETLVRTLLSVPFEARLTEALGELLGSFREDDLLAVRASPVGDPHERAILAGALETLLFVPRGEPTLAAIRQCLASAFSPAVLAARYAAGLDPLGTRLAVIVQRMVNSEVSGFLTTVDPDAIGQGPARLVVSATYGLSGGSSLGAGERRIGSDRYRVTRPLDAAMAANEAALQDPAHTLPAVLDGALVEEEIAEKQEAVRFDDDLGHGTVVRPVPSEARNLPTLRADQVETLTTEALRLERAIGRPLRLVFASAGRFLHLLEARVLEATRAGPRSQRLRVWDQRLLPGGLAGPTTPLTYSLLRRVAERVALTALRDLGAKGTERDEEGFDGRRAAAARLFGFLEGRIYANVTAFRALLELLPWHEEALEGASRGFGVPDLHEGAARAPADTDDAATSLSRLGRLLRKTHDDAEALLPAVEDRLSALRAFTLQGGSDLDADRLLDLCDEGEQLLARTARSLALLSAVCAAQYALVERLLASGGVENARGLLNDLLGGEPDEKAMGLTRAIAELVRIAREEPLVDEILRTTESSSAVLERLAELREAGVFVARLDDAIHRFGQQTLSGLKLEAPTLRARPDLLVDAVRAARAARMPDVDALAASAMGTRKKAEYLLEGQLRTRHLFGVSSRDRVALRATERLRAALASRERVRALLGESVGIVRDFVVALGQRLFELGLLDQPADVFFLTVDELRGIVRGAGVDSDPRPLVSSRKRSAARAPLSAPDRLETIGVVAKATPVAKDLPGDDGKAHTLIGVPISSGVEQGRAVIVKATSERTYRAPFLPDSIVVVERLDPGLLPRLVAARAVVVEGASVLDHVAVTLRALGIPTVGGIARATEHIEDGEPLHVDGGAGKVHLVLRMPEDEAPSDLSADPEDFARRAAPSNPEIALPTRRLQD